MSHSVVLKTLTVEEMSVILCIKPNTMHSKIWQQRTRCPLKKIGRRLFCIDIEFNDWLSDAHKLLI